ncbi:alpha/beta-hydrolase [Anaeromyces robustus]|uniref:Alpha/beta-hydrolase n=1 Tax=Anaeromyces robustus TaxID=1754192 RepID=A0A1Y1XDX4_9FUNG|nr:alpha/beta-hydrolase [Anaeromyces robustus]|eukprot:ORX83939.1 alpha/beta-hydrolase [Anaeromyces robustus]
MKLYFFPVLFYLITLATITFCNPVTEEIIEENDERVHAKVNIYDESLVPKSKRADFFTYAGSIGHFFSAKDVKRNVFYDGIKNLDIYYGKKGGRKPVVIFIYGGAWFWGEKSWYSKIGTFLSQEKDYVAVIPNYVQFPYGTLDEMVYDITNAINWVYKNINAYNGDVFNMYLVGHSSGAHLSLLTLIKSSLGLKGYGSYSVSQPVPYFQKVVLLNGPYDFDVFSKVSKETGVTTENSSFEAFAKGVLNSELSCPTDILKGYPDQSINYLSVGRIIVVHSELDTTVPYSSATGLMDQLRRVTSIPSNLYIVNGLPHCGITEGVMNDNEYAKYVLGDLLANAQ